MDGNSVDRNGWEFGSIGMDGNSVRSEWMGIRFDPNGREFCSNLPDLTLLLSIGTLEDVVGRVKASLVGLHTLVSTVAHVGQIDQTDHDLYHLDPNLQL